MNAALGSRFRRSSTGNPKPIESSTSAASERGPRETTAADAHSIDHLAAPMLFIRSTVWDFRTGLGEKVRDPASWSLPTLEAPERRQ